MKKAMMFFAAALLVTGVAFADGGKKKNKTSCNKHEGKTCSKQDMKKDDKTTTPAPAAVKN